MYKLDLEKTEEPEIKLSNSFGTQKKQENSRNSPALLITLKVFDYVDHNRLWKVLKFLGIPDHITCLLRNLHVVQEAS